MVGAKQQERQFRRLQITAPVPVSEDEALAVLEAMDEFCDAIGIELDEDVEDELDDDKPSFGDDLDEEELDVEACSVCDELDNCMLDFTPADQARLDVFIMSQAIAAAHKILDKAVPVPPEGDLCNRLQAVVTSLRLENARAEAWKEAAQRAQKLYAEAREKLAAFNPVSPMYPHQQPHQQPDTGTAPPRGYGL